MSADGLVLAVDGGGVKTDLALLDTRGALLSLVRGERSQVYYLGVDGCVEVLEALLDRAIVEAGLGRLERPFAATAQILLAGVDLPEELASLRSRIEAAELDLPPRRRQRHAGAAARRHRPRLGDSGRVRHRNQLRRGRSGWGSGGINST